MKAIWGRPVVMYDRRQSTSRRTSWRGGRREADWDCRPGKSSEHLERLRARANKSRFFLM